MQNKTATVTIKTKVHDFQYAGEDSPRYQYVDLPVIERRHCDMSAFRSHPKYGSYANSDMFKGMLARAIPRRVRLDEIPENCTVDTSGFLALVTFKL